MFGVVERFGLHITPNHYYHPIPDTKTLDDELFDNTKEMVGVDLNEKEQLNMLYEFLEYKDEYNQIPFKKTPDLRKYYFENSYFEKIDAEILYCMIRKNKPRNLIEIGSGYSTLLSAQALVKNSEEGADCFFTAIEPYPNNVLKEGFPGLSKLVGKKAQDMGIDYFNILGDGDILFIDSSHVLKIGSDVQYELQEIMPRLRKGVLVHFHDIFLPWEYPKKWVKEKHFFWTEQYLLQSFLTFNDRFKVIWAGNYMCRTHPGAIAKVFGHHDPLTSNPGSFWIKRIK